MLLEVNKADTMRWGWYPPILAYHRVDTAPSGKTPSLTPEVFERQMKILAEWWKPIPLGELVSCLAEGVPLAGAGGVPLAGKGKSSLPRRAVVVTFDDGEENTFTCAFPILARYRIPAMVFLIASNVGKPGYLRSEQIKRMQESGIYFGSHTLSHAYLPSLPLEQAEKELRLSKKILEELGLFVEFISYPAGGFTPEVLRLVREAGYRAGCTTNRGLKRFPIDRWSLRRISMHGNVTSLFKVWVRCCGYYGLNRRLRTPA